MSEQELDIYIEKVISRMCDSWHCLQLSHLHFILFLIYFFPMSHGSCSKVQHAIYEFYC